MSILKIISGGQSGVDRSALDFALKFKIDCGGWCPKGRWAEDGIIPLKYPLIETKETEVLYRTIKNIESADGTMILYYKTMDKGTQQTIDHVKNSKSAVLLIDLSKPNLIGEVQNWMHIYQIKILNIAGPRESSNPGIYQKSYQFLKKLTHLF